MPQQTCRCRMGALQTPRADHSCALLSDSAQVFKIGNTIVNVDGYLCIFQNHQNYCQRRRILASHQVLLLGGAQDSAGDISGCGPAKIVCFAKDQKSKINVSKRQESRRIAEFKRPDMVPENITLSSSHLKILPDQKVANSKHEKRF